MSSQEVTEREMFSVPPVAGLADGKYNKNRDHSEEPCWSTIPHHRACTKHLFLFKKQLDKFSAGKLLFGLIPIECFWFVLFFLKAPVIMYSQKWSLGLGDLSPDPPWLRLKFYAIYSELK